MPSRVPRPLALAARWLLVVGLGLSLPSCRSTSDDPATSSEPLTLETLQDGDGAKASGKRLMSSALGLHRLDTTTPPPTKAVIGVHGYDSEGYEWVYPLKTLGKDGRARTFFHRWDYTQCPEPMAEALGRALDELLAAQPSIESVQLVAHSYGGVITALMASRYHGKVPLLVDLVASPLAGHPGMSGACSYDGAKAPPADAPVTLRQWRTQQQLDGAFDDLDTDPQIVDLPGEVTRLPETYRGHRLGHNWSISWVVDHLDGGAPP
ncbi:alpha/beta fold hydrolase [Paraliomyxa miuraensis]|uniref:alpha/beta fold hydrolase n=1 Tax=Paraliomyxa miuraensis TaxID=376150 RepID=UPI00225716C2|nr:alpha/beta hydrolase [Paraliomyxa miuraensis]MCX4246315.1 alpha/beta hydrolase [Paraliomyxa miuraensis]